MVAVSYIFGEGDRDLRDRFAFFAVAIDFLTFSLGSWIFPAAPFFSHYVSF
jgi:hypothetical protein